MERFDEVTPASVRAIYAAWEKEGAAEAPRRYLGASVVGHACEMYLWLTFRGLVRERFEGRMYRLFDRGRREEAVFCKELRSIGCEVWEADAEGRQFAVSFLGGHFAGHCDAVAKGLPEAPATPHLCEFKTHSARSFAELERKGMRAAKPMHYAQMQVYMMGLGLERGYYLAVNKDTDALHAERVNYSAAEAKAVLARARRIIETAEPARCATREDDWRCRTCAARAVCWRRTGQTLAVEGALDCRSCCHATAVTEGEGARWRCERGKACIVGAECGCAAHLALPCLVAGEVEEGSAEAVAYRDADGKAFVNGAGGFSSDQLRKMPCGHAGDVRTVCEATGGTFTGGATLPGKYAGAAVVFEGWREELEAYLRENGVGKWRMTREEVFGDETYWEFDGSLLVTTKTGEKATVRELPPF